LDKFGGGRAIETTSGALHGRTKIKEWEKKNEVLPDSRGTNATTSEGRGREGKKKRIIRLH